MSETTVKPILMEPQDEPEQPFVVIKEKRVDGGERIGSLVELAYMRNLLLNLRDDVRALCDHEGVERDVVKVVRTREPEPLDMDGTWAEIECRVITRRLRQFRGNRSRVAASLGLSVRTVRNKINEYAIDVPTKPGRPSFDERLRERYDA